jgi:hypothetical protein
MQSDEEETLQNLYVLASICHNDKLMSQNHLFTIYANTSYRGLWRRWYGENRTQNITRIRQTLRQAIIFATRSIDTTDTLIAANSCDVSLCLRINILSIQHVRMCDALLGAITGLQHMLSTYRDDSMHSSQMCILISEIEDFLSVMNKRTQFLREHHDIIIAPRSGNASTSSQGT